MKKHFNFNADEFEGSFRINVAFEAESIEDVIKNFETFLRGAGYHFGQLVATEDTSVGMVGSVYTLTPTGMEQDWYNSVPISPLNDDILFSGANYKI